MSESVALAEKIKYSAEVTAQDCVTLNFFHSSFFLVSSFYFNLILFFGILEFQRTKNPIFLYYIVIGMERGIGMEWGY